MARTTTHTVRRWRLSFLPAVSIGELSEESGVDRGTISKVERGTDPRRLRFSTTAAIALAGATKRLGAPWVLSPSQVLELEPFKPPRHKIRRTKAAPALASR